MVSVQQFLRQVLHLSEQDQIQLLVTDAKIESVPKGTLLVETGERQGYIPFLVEGIFRGFLIDEDGRDITDCFCYQCGDVLVGCNMPGTPSSVSIEAVTNSTVLMLCVETVKEQMNSQLWVMQKYNEYLMEALRRHWEEKILLHRCPAMQRYRWFLKNYPGLIDIVSNKHIASFLGMTPVTLSRLRRQLREEGSGAAD